MGLRTDRDALEKRKISCSCWDSKPVSPSQYTAYDIPAPTTKSSLSTNRGADKSLARPGRKQVTATEDFEFRISYL